MTRLGRFALRWQALPRDGRDTLVLLAVLLWTLAPQLLRVPAWCAGLALAALAWRGVLAWWQRPLPSRRVLLAVLALASVGVLAQYRTLVGKEAGITLLVALAALKTLELRARRDAVVVFFLGFFCVLANFLYSQSLLLAAGMLVSVAGLLTTLALAHMPAGRPPLRLAAGLAVRNAVLGAPLVVVLFVFFPRVAPLWGTPADAAGRSGLSDNLELGQVAELAADDTLALRVQFDGPPPAQQHLYFRGPVLRRYDGHRWTADDGGLAQPSRHTLLSTGPAIQLSLDHPVSYRMTVEPLNVATLPLLETNAQPPQVQGDRPLDLAFRDDLHWQPHRPLTERWQLTAQAYLDARYLPGQRAQLVRPYDTALPPGAHPRTVAWAHELAARPDLQHADARALAQAVLNHIRTAGYVYTLSPGLPGGDAIDDFWLGTREGFCEHFATAFVVVMRAAGVPARIVTGYQGGRFNPVDGVLEVRQSDAHAWAEYWSDDAGWVRADPTAAVAPDRVRRDVRLLPPRNAFDATMLRLAPPGLQRLRDWWRATDHRWNEWVLGYSRTRQLDLLRDLGWQSPDLLALGVSLLWAVGLLGLGGVVWVASDSRRATREDAWLRAYRAVQATLARRGLASEPHWSAERLAQAVSHHWPASGGVLPAMLVQWSACRYGPAQAHAPTPRQWRRQTQRVCRTLPRISPACRGAPAPRPG